MLLAVIRAISLRILTFIFENFIKRMNLIEDWSYLEVLIIL